MVFAAGMCHVMVLLEKVIEALANRWRERCHVINMSEIPRYLKFKMAEMKSHE